MQRLPIPTVAALRGHVLAGGFELAIECDLRIAADDATFGLPDTTIGLSPTSGMSWRLPRIVGDGWARHLLLTGETIDVRTAERIGLVTRVVRGPDLEAAALALAESIAAQPREGLRRNSCRPRPSRRWHARRRAHSRVGGRARLLRNPGIPGQPAGVRRSSPALTWGRASRQPAARMARTGGRHRRLRLLPGGRRFRLDHRQHVATWVDEPRGPRMAHVGDAIHGHGIG